MTPIKQASVKKNSDGPNANPSRWTFFNGLALGLRPKPAYLLIFGICALFFLGAIGAGIVGAIRNDTRLLLFAFGALLMSLAAAVIVVLRVEPIPPRPEPRPNPDPPAPVSDPSFDDVLYAIHQNVRKALTIKNETFREAIRFGCDNFRATTAEWSDGQIRVQRNYNDLLVKFYEAAKQTVFSTSIPDYLPTWRGTFGRQLLEVHKRSSASVTRVFLFDRRKDVTEEAARVMAEQSTAGVNVLLFFGDEHSDFEFLPGISKDFTLIDGGEAIGITLSFGGQNLAAQWYIEDQDQKGRFEQFAKRLLQTSERLSQFEQCNRQQILP